MLISFIQRISNYLIDTREKGKSLLLLVSLIIAIIFFLPSSVVDLRIQRSLFPMMAIYLFVCGMIYIKANRMIGILGIFSLIYSVYMFTPDSYSFLLVSIFYLAIYFLVVVFYDDFKNSKELIYNVLCTFALINIIWIVLQHSGIYIFFAPKIEYKALETGWFANRNEVSAFFAITTPMFFRGKWTSWKTPWTLRWYLGLIPLVCGFIMAQCTNGVIAASVVSCVYGGYILFKKYGKVVIPILIGLLFLFIVIVASYMNFVHTGAYKERLEAFSASFELVKEKPVFGWGIGQSYYVVPVFLNGEKLDKEVVQMSVNNIYYRNDFIKLYKDKHNFKNTIHGYWPQLHNDPLQWIIDTGIIGGVLFALIILSHILAAFKLNTFPIIPFLVVTSTLITSLAFFTLQMGCFLFIIVLFMALIQGEYKIGR